MADSSTRTDDQLQAVAWPVGAVYFGADETDPAEVLGFGKWTEMGKIEINAQAAYAWKREE